MNALFARFSLLLFLLSAPAASAEVPEGFLLRMQLETSQLNQRHWNTLLSDMVENKIEHYYLMKSGLIVTSEKLTSYLTELLKHSDQDLSESDRKTIVTGRVRNWEHKVTQKDVREELELARREIAGYELQLRRIGGE